MSMRIFDPIYGAFDLPPGFESLILAPEVRRLSAIRLLNTNSPTFATLGDLRRYSHTLGVLRLCLQLEPNEFSESERRALLAAVLVHDVGTPPFAHLFELLIKERYGWDHETAARTILLGNSVPENSAHQIFHGRSVSFRRELRRANVDVSLVQAIVTKEHPLSKLLFGSLDLDNLDNVIRMAWALGLKIDAGEVLSLAGALSVDKSGELLLNVNYASSVERWLDIRRSVYELLIFDEATVAAQAVLADAMRRALDADELGPEDWSLTDEDCLARLKQCNSVNKGRLEKFFGVLPSLSLVIQIRDGTKIDNLKRQDMYDLLCYTAEEICGRPGLAYMARDKKTFSRRLEFIDPSTRKVWSVGQDTRSIVLYHFCEDIKRSSEIGKLLMQKLLRALGLSFDDVIKYSLGGSTERSHDQQAFDFTT